MSKYTGKPITVNHSAQAVADKFDDLSSLQNVVDSLPEAERAKFGNVGFSSDSIIIETPQLGEIHLKVVEHTPKLVKFQAVGLPVPLDMMVDIKEISPESSELAASIDLQIPAMLRPMVAPQMQKAVDMLTDVVARVANR